MRGLVAIGGQDFTGELIVRLIGGHGFADPLVEGKRGRTSGLVAAALDPEDVGPFVGEEIAVLRRLEQAIDQPGALIRVLVIDECCHLGGGRQRASDIERCAGG